MRSPQRCLKRGFPSGFSRLLECTVFPSSLYQMAICGAEIVHSGFGGFAVKGPTSGLMYVLCGSALFRQQFELKAQGFRVKGFRGFGFRVGWRRSPLSTTSSDPAAETCNLKALPKSYNSLSCQYRGSCCPYITPPTTPYIPRKATDFKAPFDKLCYIRLEQLEACSAIV